MALDRASGILLHPTSLPSPYGIGEMGKEAIKFIDFLKASGQKLWQILPLNPPGYGSSPYQAFSAFAGNSLLISLEQLYKDGLLTSHDLYAVLAHGQGKVNYELVKELKEPLLRKAFERFISSGKELEEYAQFIQANYYWISDYAQFMALKNHFSQRPWNEWEKEVALRNPQVLAHYENLLADNIEYQYFLQYQFHKQWGIIKTYAADNGIRIIGDIPIFVSYDSSDTWVHSHLFELDERGNPAKVAGVPPDYFSATGQRWGNPHYKWDKMAQDDYFWWRQRFQKLLEDVDIIRVDHFRGFESYWEIPAQEETAINGRWVKGPGEQFFKVLEDYLGKLPIIAEDLGLITSDVVKLKKSLGFPGMKVLQFVSKEDIPFEQQEEEIVFYTGTHDNDTLLGWYQENVLKELDKGYGQDLGDICWEFIDLVMQSKASWVIFPLQDILCLGSEARMNKPGTTWDNWQWRFLADQLEPGFIRDKMSELVQKSSRRY